MNDTNNILSTPLPDNTDSVSASIKNLIHVIRGQQVMIDSDLSRLYGIETRVLNQAVKRNADRFPEDFMFKLTKEECLRSQIVTLNAGRGQHIKYAPFAFTENTEIRTNSKRSIHKDTPLAVCLKEDTNV